MALISVGQLSIVDANDGLSAQLTSNSIVLPADAAGNVNSYVGAETSFTIFEGGVDMSSRWGYFVSATGGGVTYRDINDATNRTDVGPSNGVLDSNYLKITSLTQALSWIDITATRAQQQNIVRRYSIAKANTGATGTRGTLTATRAISDQWRYRHALPRLPSVQRNQSLQRDRMGNDGRISCGLADHRWISLGR
jgi:hypothetical protein